MEIRFDRLQQLADHLRYGNLGHAKFDFSVLHNKATLFQKFRGHCGSNGCAIGELPMVFPAHFSYRKGADGSPQIHQTGVGFLLKRAMICNFFQITNEDLEHLFYPNGQITSQLPPRRSSLKLDKFSSREDVAENIEWFIKNQGFRKSSDIVTEAIKILVDGE